MERIKSLILGDHHKGLATIETAIVLPFLLIIVFGLLQYGWLFFRYHQITNTVNRGARVAILPTAQSVDVETVINELMTDYGMQDTQYVVELDPAEVSDAVPLQVVKVRISVPYKNIAPFGAAFVPLPDSLTYTVTMAREGPIP